MDFYDYKVKDIRKELSEFGKGAYGKTIFTIAYTPTLFLAIIIILIEIYGIPGCILCSYADYLPFWILALIFTFLIGNAYYYSELRKFMEFKAKRKHRLVKLENKSPKKSTKKH